MNVKIKVTKNFKKQVKILLKKYHSLDSDLRDLESKLKGKPELGIPLGFNAYKIRLAIKSKGKGKSGGARVITYLETEIIGHVDKSKNVNLISIYDKSEVDNISNKELKNLIENIEFD